MERFSFGCQVGVKMYLERILRNQAISRLAGPCIMQPESNMQQMVH